jgi:hypothetical protein
MRKMKILVPTIVIILLAIMLAAPVNACNAPVHSKTKTIPFTLTVYFVGPTTSITLDNTLVSVTTPVCSEFNTAKGVGHGVSKYVDTYTNNGIIGTGTIKGTSRSTITTADGSVGTALLFGYGSSDKYSSIIEISRASWEPTTVPFPTVVLTVTGVFIVQQ